MSEYIRTTRITVEIDTNKHTYTFEGSSLDEMLNWLNDDNWAGPTLIQQSEWLNATISATTPEVKDEA